MEKEKLDELFELLVSSGTTKLTLDWGNSSYGHADNCYANSSSFYICSKGDPYYSRFSLKDEKGKEEYLNAIVKVEKEIDGEFFPIWTREDGIVKDYEQFVRINGRYYTIAQLEHIFSAIESIKKDFNVIISY